MDAPAEADALIESATVVSDSGQSDSNHADTVSSDDRLDGPGMDALVDREDDQSKDATPLDSVNSNDSTGGASGDGGDARPIACRSSMECSDTTYCFNGDCVPRKPLGAVCASSDECTTSICGGRCCSTPCTCPQPGAQNLFKNPGFDNVFSDWDSHNGDAQWNGGDADGCPYSGSAQVVSSQGPSQCVAVVAGQTYNFVGWFKNADGKYYDCYLVPYGDATCSTSAPDSLIVIPGTAPMGTETTWTFKAQTVQVPTSVHSVYLVCDANTNTYIDKLFLSANGFY